jgi:hypothetical protein
MFHSDRIYDGVPHANYEGTCGQRATHWNFRATYAVDPGTTQGVGRDMKPIVFFLALVASACSGSDPQSSPYNIPVAAVGTWADFGTGTGSHSPPITKAVDGKWSFAFPAKVNGNSVNYVYTKPASLSAGQTITLAFNIDGDATFGNADPSDTGTPSLHLFIWEAGDDLSGQNAFGYYRWWCSRGAVLTVGDNQSVACVVNPENWSSVFGESGANSVTARAGFAQAVRNVAYVGFTFGGSFFGHGVWTTTGSARFVINGVSVK